MESQTNIIPNQVYKMLEDAWLGISVNEAVLYNPLLNIPQDFEDNLEYYLTYLMMQPEYFHFLCKEILNIELVPFQGVILQELWHRKFPLLIGTRGGGKTFLLALYAILRALLIPSRKIVIAGSVFRQSKFVFEYIERIWAGAPIFRDICRHYDKFGAKKDTDMWRFFIGDSTITAIPVGPSGESIRGLRAEDLIVDEAKSVNREILETVLVGFLSVSSTPVESVKAAAKQKMMSEMNLELDLPDQALYYPNQLILSGTAYYQFNHFYQYWKMWHDIIQNKGQVSNTDSNLEQAQLDYRDFSIIRIPLELIPKGFMEEAQIARSKATMHSGTYDCEYGAVFSTDSAGFFKRALLESCTVGPECSISFPSCGHVMFTPTIRGRAGNKYVFGVDPASEVDNFAIVILEVHPDHRRIVYTWTINRKQQKEAIASGQINENDFYGYCAMKIRSLMKYFPCASIALDSQGGGIPILEALGRKEGLREGESPLLEIIEPGKPKLTDGKDGIHIIELINFASIDWVSEANHGLRKAFEDKICLFPSFSNLSFALAEAVDNMSGRSYDTLEDCVMEIEELKNELSSIIITKTATGRDRWDTPDTLEAGKKKGRMRKDRYSALLMANYAATKLLQEKVEPTNVFGGFSYDLSENDDVSGPEFIGPSWFTKKMAGVYG